jgi:hypothetical protein
MLKKPFCDRARCQKAICGIYFTKNWRAETRQPGLEFGNIKPRLQIGIFKCITWLKGSFLAGDDWAVLEDWVKRPIYWHQCSPLTRQLFFFFFGQIRCSLNPENVFSFFLSFDCRIWRISILESRTSRRSIFLRGTRSPVTDTTSRLAWSSFPSSDRWWSCNSLQRGTHEYENVIERDTPFAPIVIEKSFWRFFRSRVVNERGVS